MCVSFTVGVPENIVERHVGRVGVMEAQAADELAAPGWFYHGWQPHR